MADKASRALKKRITKVSFWLGVGILVFGGAVFAFFLTSKISLFAVAGDSMEPALKDRDSLVLQQIDAVEQGQLIIFNKPKAWKYAANNDGQLIKRVLAVPGDTLEFDGKDFFVNGISVYSLAQDNYECAAGPIGYTHQLTRAEVFVAGDNALRSLDSRRIFCDGHPESMFPNRLSVIDYGVELFTF